MRVKICGITDVEQGRKIAEQGADSLGFICVERSPRYVTPEQIATIGRSLSPQIDRVGVFANSPLDEIVRVLDLSGLTAIQLHGAETPDFCLRLRQLVPPEIELIKAFRIKSSQSLTETANYSDCVDTFLLDAYHPKMLGGTGEILDWQGLAQFQPALPWMLAGGLTPDNVTEALNLLHPAGIDLSSGVERSPGDKDLTQVARLFEAINSC